MTTEAEPTYQLLTRLDGRFPIVSIRFRGRHLPGALVPFAAFAPGLIFDAFRRRRAERECVAYVRGLPPYEVLP